MKQKVHGLQRDILRLSVPAVVSNVTVPLLGLCDTAISGHLGSAVYLGAIAVGSMMMNVMFWLFGFLRMGTSGLTANAFGAGDLHGQSELLGRAVLTGVAIGLLLLILQTPLEQLLTAAIGPTPDVMEYSSIYFRICVWGSPALLATMAISGWFVGMQSTFWPMVIAIATNLVNITVSFLLAFPFGLGFRGVALGTLTANWVGVALAAWAVWHFAGPRLPRPRISEILKGRELLRFFSVNTNLFFRSACIMGISLAVTGVGASYGAVLLGANAVAMQFFHLFSYFMDGYAFTAEALVGRFIGAGDRNGLRAGVRSLMIWTLSLIIVFTLCYGLGWRHIALVLTDVGEVVEALAMLAPFITAIPVMSAWAFVFDGFYIGATRTRRMLMATVIAAGLFFLTAFLRVADGNLVIATPSLPGLWFSFLLYLLVRGGLLGLLWPSTVKRVFLNNPDKS